MCKMFQDLRPATEKKNPDRHTTVGHPLNMFCKSFCIVSPVLWFLSKRNHVSNFKCWRHISKILTEVVHSIRYMIQKVSQPERTQNRRWHAAIIRLDEPILLPERWIHDDFHDRNTALNKTGRYNTHTQYSTHYNCHMGVNITLEPQIVKKWLTIDFPKNMSLFVGFLI